MSVLRTPFEAAARTLGLLAETIRACIRTPPPRRAVLAQMFNTGNRSLLFLLVTMGFLGMITVYQGCLQAMKVLPDLSNAGAIFIMAMVREFGPTITALMLATRVGTGIAAEIAAMVVSDQVEALKVSSTDPIAFLVTPRFLGFVVMMFVCTVYSCAVAVAAGLLMAELRFQINPHTFLSLSFTRWSDLYVGLAKTFAYGVAIPILSADSGFRATGGSEGVGWATTRAVINSTFAIIFLDFVIAGIGYLLVRGT